MLVTNEMLAWMIVGLIAAAAVSTWLVLKLITQVLSYIQQDALEQHQSRCNFPDVGSLQVAMQKSHEAELAAFNTLTEMIDQLQSDESERYVTLRSELVETAKVVRQLRRSEYNTKSLIEQINKDV